MNAIRKVIEAFRSSGGPSRQKSYTFEVFLPAEDFYTGTSSQPGRK